MSDILAVSIIVPVVHAASAIAATNEIADVLKIFTAIPSFFFG
ncbi:MAG: hypothetical protein VCD66_18590 [Alphaproteobacteria bacterium]